ncbi:MAG: glycoside hydrolase family 31 protein [Hyphomicrobiales bacterium]|nr:glycoside hydrolase family 31 protein [Hyphomicrobiales bacterium]MDE2113340.1 glycoside hydrolase family 31 protein [Hyphomicrobiales bacterium]
MKALGKSTYLGQDGAWALLDAGLGCQLAIAILAPGIARISLRRREGWRLDRSWSLAPGGLESSWFGRSRSDLSGFPLPAMHVNAAPQSMLISGGGMQIHVNLANLGLTFQRTNGSLIARDRTTQAYLVSNKTPAFAHFMERDALDRHYGLGDKAGPLDHTGRRFKMDAVDPCGFDAEISDPLYKVLPFTIISGSAGTCGIFYDTLTPAEVDLGCTIDNYHGLFRSFQAQDGDLDYYVIDGPSMADVVQRFSWMTGGHSFAPKWSLGFGCTSMTIADAPDADARIADFIARTKAHDIPCDSFHFGSGYTSIGKRRYVFNWNYEKFPNPGATMASLKAAGMMPVTNIKPCLLDDHPRLHEAERDGLLVKDDSGTPAVAQFWDGLGFHIDFTNPKARAWWRNGIETALLDKGVVSVWNDNNEYEIWDEDAKCDGDGHPFAQALARPAQSMLMTRLSYETQMARDPASRPYVITRAGPAGLGRYGQTWTGDNETAWKTLRYNLTQGLNMSLSGLFNIGHDVGGFHGPSPDPELFCRFVEFCSLWPRFIMNSWKDDGIVNLPWMHASVLEQVRSAMQWRYRLMPYIYTLAHAASARREPMVRPLAYDFAQDPVAIDVEDAFMLGSRLLVAPVLSAGERQRRVYLPVCNGGWWHLATRTQYNGGETVIVDAPLGALPIFVRAGTVLPISAKMSLLSPEPDTPELWAFGGNTGAVRSELYDDNGTTTRWQDGDCFHAELQLLSGPEGAAHLAIHLNQTGFRPAYDTFTVRAIGISKLTLQPSPWLQSAAD